MAESLDGRSRGSSNSSVSEEGRSRSNSVSNDVIEDCEELMLKAYLIIHGKEKGLPEEGRRYLSQCCDHLEEFMKYRPGQHYACWLLSYAYFERAKLEKNIAAANTSTMTSATSTTATSSPLLSTRTTPTNLLHTYMSAFSSSFSDDSKLNITKSLEKVQKCCTIEEQDEDTYLLWAHILLYLADSITSSATASSRSLKDNEELLVQAADKLLKATQLRKPIHKRTYTLLESVMDRLTNGPKHRERSGVAVYKYANDLLKQGSTGRAWQHRWFVLADSNLSYYKDKKEWENGPVKGNAVQPKGAIELRDIVNVFCHNENNCTVTKPKKYENSFCLHVQTELRTYHFLGLDSKEEAELWQDHIKFAVKSFNIRKACKKWLKDKQALKEANEGEYSDLIDRVLHRKTTNQRALRYSISYDRRKEEELHLKMEIMKKQAEEHPIESGSIGRIRSPRGSANSNISDSSFDNGGSGKRP